MASERDRIFDGETLPSSEQMTAPSAQASSAAGPVPGQTWARYLVIAPLGAGGMGAVWAAHDPDLERDVALKVLHDELLGRAGQERLRREARAMARVSHPNVVPVFEVGEHAGRSFYTMELVRGRSVKDWLREPRSPHEIARVFAEAARGLAAIHAAGLVHRDVKPGNVLYGDDARARIADLGIAMSAAEPVDDSVPLVATTTVRHAGTPAYMAPEQLRGSAGDAASDQFSFGVALWEALHGAPPFDGDTIAARLQAIERGAPSSTRDVPAWLDAVARRAMAADPAQRFDGLPALIRALEHPPRRRWPRWLAAALAVTGAIAVAVIVSGRGDDASTPAPPPAQAATRAALPPARALTRLGVDVCAEAPAFADASTIVFDLTRGDAVDLYRVPVAGGEPVALVQTPHWDWHASPGRRAGEIVHLVSNMEDQARSYVAYVDVATGVEARAADVVANDVAVAGDALYYTNMTGREVRRLRGQLDEVIVAPRGHAMASQLAVSPRGDHVAYAGQRSDGTAAVCVVAPGGEPTCMTSVYEGARPAFSPDGAALYYAGLAGIVRHDLATGADLLVGPGARAPGGLAIAPDGRHLAYSRCGATSHLLDVTAASPRAVLDDDRATEPAIGPGGALAWTERDHGVNVLHVRLPDGHQLQLTVAALGSVRFPAFSPDGRAIVFSVLGGATPGLYKVEVIAGASPIQLTDDARDTGAVWTRDLQIAFTREGDDGVKRAYLLDPATARVTRVGLASRIVVGADPRTGELLLRSERLSWLDPRTQRERPGPSNAPPEALYTVMSPNGRWLLIQAGPTAREVWRMPLDRPAEAERVYTGATTLDRGAIDDDGRVVVSVQGWSGELYVVTAAPGTTL